MASSNRHWPSLFKSKPCNQWQNDLNSPLVSNNCHRSSPYNSASVCEERTPEPKPRWNPKPEQIRILEAIFDSGMVNPPRDEIRKIRAQLQEYGQVGDANVFYWFQNRKSRSKHKLRHLQNSKKNTQSPNPNPNPNSLMPSSTTATATPPSSSSSSSSDKLSPSGSHKTNLSLNSPTGSVNQSYFQHHNQTQGGDYSMNEPSNFLFAPQHGMINPSFSEVQNIGPCTSLLLNEVMMINNMSTNTNDNTNNNNNSNDPSAHGVSEKINVGQCDHEKFVKLLHMQKNHLGLINTTPLSSQSTHSSVTTTTSVGLPALASNASQIQGVAEAGSLGPVSGPTAKSTVFINDVAFEVPAGPFNLREAFGEGAVLINATSGQPVLTNEWGLTIQSLQHGAFYYLM